MKHEPDWTRDACRWCGMGGQTQHEYPDLPCFANPWRRRLDWLITPIRRSLLRQVRLALYRNGACLRDLEGRTIGWSDLWSFKTCEHAWCDEFRARAQTTLA